MPKFALYVVNSVDLPASNNVSIFNPSNNSIIVDIWRPIKVPPALYPSLGPMTVSFFLPDTEPHIIPFRTISLPKLKFKPGEYLHITNQTLIIADADQLALTLTRYGYNNEVTIVGRAKAPVGIGALHTHVELNKVKTFPGRLGEQEC